MEARIGSIDALVFGNWERREDPLAILVHGFPDTPHTWRHLGPALARAGWRVAAPWLPGYREPASEPISVGTYVHEVLTLYENLGGDARCVLIGHDWGASTGYGVAALAPHAFARLVTLAVPPMGALGESMFDYDQARRSFYIWLIQLPGMAEAVLLRPGFLESLWRDWSPGYDPGQDLAVLRRWLTPSTVTGIVTPYRCAFGQAEITHRFQAAATAALQDPPLPTLYLHGSRDGALGAEVLSDVESHLPGAGSNFRLLEGLGHFLHLEAPETIERLVLEWLAEG